MRSHAAGLTKRQKLYQKYLRSDHWKALRSAALERDGGKCVVCESTDRLQVHHAKYRGLPEATEIGDLETLCRECHWKEHGYGPLEFDVKIRDFNHKCNTARQRGNLPREDEERDLVRLALEDPCLGEPWDWRWSVIAAFRDKALMRLILTSDRAWEKWIPRSKILHSRLRDWCESKFNRFADQIRKESFVR